MVRSEAESVPEYLSALVPDSRYFVSVVRDVVLENLPQGYEEAMNWGMLSYQVPLDRYPETYNRQPLA